MRHGLVEGGVVEDELNEIQTLALAPLCQTRLVKDSAPSDENPQKFGRPCHGHSGGVR